MINPSPFFYLVPLPLWALLLRVTKAPTALCCLWLHFSACVVSSLKQKLLSCLWVPFPPSSLVTEPPYSWMEANQAVTHFPNCLTGWHGRFSSAPPPPRCTWTRSGCIGVKWCKCTSFTCPPPGNSYHNPTISSHEFKSGFFSNKHSQPMFLIPYFLNNIYADFFIEEFQGIF